MRSSRSLVPLLALALLLALLPAVAGAQEPPDDGSAHVAGGFTFVKPLDAVTCGEVDSTGFIAQYFTRGECFRIDFDVSNTDAESAVVLNLIGPDGGEPFATFAARHRGDTEWRVIGRSDDSWAAGAITAQVVVEGDAEPAGEATFFHNQLGADITAPPKEDGSAYAPGEAIAVTGNVHELNDVVANTEKTGVPAEFFLRVRHSDGTVSDALGPFTADSEGNFAETVPGELTSAIVPTADTQFKETVAIEAVDATYQDPDSGPWFGESPGETSVTIAVTPDALLLENSFVSSVGWVKPGQEYPFRLIVRNLTGAAVDNATVTVPAPDGTTFLSAQPLDGAGSASVGDGSSITWTIPSVAAGTVMEPTVATLVVLARADSLGEDPQVSWKNLSTTATLSSAGGEELTVTSHGPKVIPPNSTYETARYGDRPFPVVPVDYRDRKHSDGNSGDDIARIINDPEFEGSTFNLFQEMSYGQLFPQAEVPSAGIATAEWGDYDFDFSETPTPPPSTCTGTHGTELIGSPLLPERIVNGFYQLPGDTGYYGQDSSGTAIAVGQIDAGCGDTGKSVYDAAAIADPEIDYNDFDTDKDGIVDFFMMIFVGAGGNGVSQTSVPPYDNIWPHSSTLESGFFDPETGLSGYVSDDQLTDLQGRPLYYTDEGRSQMTTDETEFPVFVRVGPYNVNPETSLEAASVISHEYGHSLGLPDYYSNGGAVPVVDETEFYDTWNLMATDYSQHMDVQARQQLGWVVPRVLPPGESIITDMAESNVNTHRVDWVTPDGEPYTLEGPSVNNGEAYAAKLPPKLLIEPEIVENGASPSHVWFSGSGNGFGCPPQEGHNLDIILPGIQDLPEGTPITLEYKTFFDIEWDFDYGFTMVTTDGGETYQALPSEMGYTTEQSNNPNGSSCQGRYGNGLTGTSESHANGNPSQDRLPEVGSYPQGDGFVQDRYDLSEFAGENVTLRFAYATDVGLARPGWFIDDLVVKAGDQVIYETNFEDSGDPSDPSVYNGGCQEDLMSGPVCTEGWSYISSEVGSPADHAYYFELRDRTGFDLDANGQADRGPITWAPGLSLAFTNESEGLGNSSEGMKPNQHILDSQPDPENKVPNLDDAAFVAGETYSDFGEGHVDNYVDPEAEDGLFRFAFDCMEFEVLEMSGTEVGPEEPPGDLTADVAVRTGEGCAEYDYGFGRIANGAPTAIAQAKPTEVAAGEEVTFDGSQSFDDLTAAAGLTYSWDFDGDGTEDATGSSVRHAYEAPGEYTASLTVTDPEGLTGVDDVVVTVTGAAQDAITRVSGPNRVATAIAVSQQAFESADQAVIARTDTFPDALAAATLAAEIDGPVLITDTSELQAEVADELERLGVTRAYLAGGTEALSEQVAADLAEIDIETERLDGATRFETAALIAAEVVQLGGQVEQAVVARADEFPDALAAGNLGTYGRAPILLTATDELPEVTAQALESSLSGSTVYIAGGTAAVGTGPEGQLDAAGYDVERLGGAERYETAALIVQEAIELGADSEPTYLASGANFPDALAAAPAAHAIGGTLLLVHPTDLDDSVASRDYLSANAAEINTVFIAGGTEAVSNQVADQVREAVAAQQ